MHFCNRLHKIYIVFFIFLFSFISVKKCHGGLTETSKLLLDSSLSWISCIFFFFFLSFFSFFVFFQMERRSIACQALAYSSFSNIRSANSKPKRKIIFVLLFLKKIVSPALYHLFFLFFYLKKEIDLYDMSAYFLYLLFSYWFKEINILETL